MNIEIPSIYYSILERKYRSYVFYGGRGGGKTIGIIRACLSLLLTDKIRIAVFQKEKTSNESGVYKDFNDDIERLKLDHLFKMTKEKITAHNGSEVLFFGGNNVYSRKGLAGISICWYEEASNIPAEVFKIVNSTIRGVPKLLANGELEAHKVSFIYSFNPRYATDWVYKEFLENKERANQPDILICKVNFYDNPYFKYSGLEEEKDYSKKNHYLEYLHIWEGEAAEISEASIFYGKFDVVDFYNKDKMLPLIGIDFGFASDPTAIILCYIDERNIYVDKEYYQYGDKIEDMAVKAKTAIPEIMNYPCYADTASPAFIDYLKGNGLPLIQGAMKGNDSVIAGIEFIRNKNVFINKECHNLVREITKYSWEIDQITGAFLPRPRPRQSDHAIDALRYAVSHLIKRRISIADVIDRY